MSLEYQYFPVSRPSKGAGGKTGNWRVVRPVVNLDKCIGCKACYLWCPEATIIPGDKVSIDYEYCKGCGICSNVCPVKAIQMVSEA
ncbi:4Fe-4S binding protein [Acidianus manzaensis]|uniref:Ferredoxin n=1 Tax=Acidianus manzaensis TaxID=282676 RepID=A0A1W6JWS0_9CREN|nr:4Fe-4S binding protein [Acidianus manzaensis]ARM74731.1 ferredoxin [Acidianus manzaensis]